MVNDSLFDFFPKATAWAKLVLDVVSPTPHTVEIVGVVGDIRERELEVRPEPTMYLLDISPAMSVLVKVCGNPTLVAGSIAAAVRRVNPNGAVGQVHTLRQSIDSSLGRQRFALILMVVFATLGIILCVVGIYGVFGYGSLAVLRGFRHSLRSWCPAAGLGHPCASRMSGRGRSRADRRNRDFSVGLAIPADIAV